MSRFWPVFAFLLAALLLGCGGGGGGGGGTTGTTTFLVFGRILWIETGAAPAPAATVRVGSTSVTTDVTDGSFQLQAAQGSTTITVTYADGGGGAPVVRTFTVPPITSSVDLGDFYIGPETVTITGRLVSNADGSPIAGGAVSIAGITGVSAADGTFSLPGVAYSSSTLAVFLGLQGEASATGFFTGFFSPPGPEVGGIVNVGDVALTPQGSDDPPPLPFNIQGTVLPVTNGAGATVELLSGGNVIRTTTADGAGKFFLWAPVGTYTVRATNGALTGQANVTVVNVNGKVTVNVSIS